MTCPSCGVARTARIVYGLVPPDVMESDDLVLGGCVVAPGPEPDRACRDCGHRWRVEPAPLSWPDPRGHDDGELVTVSGTVGKVTLEATDGGDMWAELELVVGEGLPRLRCTAFPTVIASLDFALEPLIDVELVGRFSRGPNGPSLHVRDSGLRIG